MTTKDAMVKWATQAPTQESREKIAAFEMGVLATCTELGVPNVGLVQVLAKKAALDVIEFEKRADIDWGGLAGQAKGLWDQFQGSDYFMPAMTALGGAGIGAGAGAAMGGGRGALMGGVAGAGLGVGTGGGLALSQNRDAVVGGLNKVLGPQRQIPRLLPRRHPADLTRYIPELIFKTTQLLW